MNATCLVPAGGVFLLALLAACGGGGGGMGAAAGSAMQPLATATPSQSASCADGAMSIRIGLDANGNGSLDTGEVSYTELVCTGAGESGWLVRLVDEPAGANCAAGGQRALIGRDTDGDGVLQASEAASSAYVCNGGVGATGATGGQGPAGSDGVNSLMSVTAEPAGANCAAGGRRVQSGLDADRDGALAVGEVAQTSYVCNGATGATGATGTNGDNGLDTLLLTATEPAGSNCTHGGTRVENGRDANRDAVLDPGEVAQTAYVCNPPPAGLAWASIDVDTDAAANTGYIVTGVQQTQLTLPDAPPPGSVVRVSGLGAGGWRIEQRTGQSILTRPLPLAARWNGPWVQALSGANWDGIASSADGLRLAAVSRTGDIVTSTDGGATWTQRRSGTERWRDVASSADGQRLIVARDGGTLEISTDGGATWTPSATSRQWIYVASSADGQVLAAIGDFISNLYMSRDGGNSWSLAMADVVSVAVSADGTHVLALPRSSSSQAQVSADSGVSWTPRGPSLVWFGAAVSADGSRMVAGAGTTTASSILYTSTDFGVTWTPRNVSVLFWTGLAMSADGRVMVGVNTHNLYVSENFGATWTERHPGHFDWTAVACSSDCGRMAATRQSAPVITSPQRTHEGPGRGLAGASGSTVELQYLGGGTWTVLAFAGEVNTR